MELSIARRRAKDFLVPKMKNDKNEIDDTKMIANSVINESMVVHATPLKSFSKKKKKQKLKESMMARKSDAQLLKKDKKKFIHFLTLML